MKVYTYEDQPHDNVDAWRLGMACLQAAKSPGGDYIDSGLGLLKELQEQGYGVVKLDDKTQDFWQRLYDETMDTLYPAMDHVQQNADKYGARPGDDKVKHVVAQFMRDRQAQQVDAAAIRNAALDEVERDLIELRGTASTRSYDARLAVQQAINRVRALKTDQQEQSC